MWKEKEYIVGNPSYCGATFSVSAEEIEGQVRFCLGMVTANPARQGYGSAVIRKFVEDVGPGKLVYSSVVHEPTLRELERQGWLEQAKERGEILKITDQEVLRSLPVVRFLEKGRIAVNFLTIGYDNTAFPSSLPFNEYNVYVFGYTK